MLRAHSPHFYTYCQTRTVERIRTGPSLSLQANRSTSTHFYILLYLSEHWRVRTLHTYQYSHTSASITIDCAGTLTRRMLFSPVLTRLHSLPDHLRCSRRRQLQFLPRTLQVARIADPLLAQLSPLQLSRQQQRGTKPHQVVAESEGNTSSNETTLPSARVFRRKNEPTTPRPHRLARPKSSACSRKASKASATETRNKLQQHCPQCTYLESQSPQPNFETQHGKEGGRDCSAGRGRGMRHGELPSILVSN